MFLFPRLHASLLLFSPRARCVPASFLFTLFFRGDSSLVKSHHVFLIFFRTQSSFARILRDSGAAGFYSPHHDGLRQLRCEYSLLAFGTTRLLWPMKRLSRCRQRVAFLEVLCTISLFMTKFFFQLMSAALFALMCSRVSELLKRLKPENCFAVIGVSLVLETFLL